MDKIISPIAQYINANPVPPLMKHIRPKTSKFLDAEIQESLRDENMPSPKSTQTPKKVFAPLPAAKYCSSKVAIQIPVAPDSEPKELPKAFGIANTVQATVSHSNKSHSIILSVLYEEIYTSGFVIIILTLIGS